MKIWSRPNYHDEIITPNKLLKLAYFICMESVPKVCETHRINARYSKMFPRETRIDYFVMREAHNNTATYNRKVVMKICFDVLFDLSIFERNQSIWSELKKIPLQPCIQYKSQDLIWKCNQT